MLRIITLWLLISTGTIVLATDFILSDKEAEKLLAACDDYHVLKELFLKTNGENWLNNENWLIDSCDVCNWYGVDCADGRVVKLRLWNNNLSGHIPDLSELDSLKEIDLSYNQFSELPQSLGEISRLELIDFSQCNINGAIPSSWFNLPHLKYLRLRNNHLTGSLPNQISGWDQIEEINLSNNQFFGSLPASILKKSLRVIQFSQNDFSGSIPQSLNSLDDLETIGLNRNEFEGEILDLFNGLLKLKSIDIHSNQFTGKIPSTIGQLKDLFTLSLHNNEFDDVLPFEIGDLDALNTLNLSNNNFSGSLPANFYHLSSLRYLNLSSNNLSGSLSSSISNFSQVYNLTLSGNQFSGFLPENIGSLSELQYLRLSGNLFGGIIPESFSEFTKIRTLLLNNNQFEGPFPDYFGDYPELNNINLFSNKFTGCFPESYSSFCSFASNSHFSGNCTFENPSFTEFCSGSPCNGGLSLEVIGDSVLCAGEYHTIEAPSGYSEYHWELSSENEALVSFQIPESGFYKVTITNFKGCSKVDSVYLELLDAAQGYFESELCTGESITINSEVYDMPGLFTQLISIPNGCDSILNINLIELQAPSEVYYADICFGDILALNGESFTEAGYYEQILTANNGCDSILSIELHVSHEVSTNLSFDICHGQSIELNGHNYSGGNYTQVFSAENGCDSVLYISINEAEPVEIFNYNYICEGESISLLGQHFNDDVTISVPLINDEGCVSYIRYVVNVLEHSHSYHYYALCDNETIELNGMEYQEAGIFEQVIENEVGCDSTLHVQIEKFASDLIYLNYELCDDESILLNGIEYSEGGIYTQQLMNSAGCDSIIQIQIQKSYSVSEYLQLGICEDEEILINGISYTEAGIYTQQLTTAGNCDSTLIIEINENGLSIGNEHHFICPGDGVEINGINYVEGGTYFQNFISNSGCDSLLVIGVEMGEHTDESIHYSLCNGESVEINGEILQEGGFYTQVLLNSSGCDSTIYITIEERFPSSGYIFADFCQGDSILINGIQYEEGGVYEQVLINSVGCDSVLIIELTEHEASYEDLFTSICDQQSITINFIHYDSPGTYYQNLVNKNNCDSTLQIHIELADRKDTSIYALICQEEEIEIAGQVFTGNGDFVIETSTEQGCDSIIYLFLTEVNGKDTTLNIQICEGEVFEFGQSTLYETGIYQDSIIWNGCLSWTTLNLEVIEPIFKMVSEEICEGESFYFGGKFLEESGIYTHRFSSYAGCDSTVELHLQFKPHLEIRIDTFLCTGESLYFHQWLYDHPGQFILNRKTSYGCDLTVYLNFNWIEEDTLRLNEQICEGESFDIGGNSFEFEGLYSGAIETDQCDQFYELELSVLPIKRKDSTIILCDEPGYWLNQEFFPQGFSSSSHYQISECNILDQISIVSFSSETSRAQFLLCEGDTFRYDDIPYFEEGTYILEFEDQCFSQGVLEIFVANQEIKYIESVVGPDRSFVLFNKVFTEPGEYELEIEAEHCSVLFKINLKPEHCSFEQNTSITLCSGESVDFYGQELSTTGIYSHSITAANGCDSLINLELLVLPAFNIDIEADLMICDGEEVHLKGPEGFNYQWSTGSVNKDIVVTVPGIYYLTLTDDNQCSEYLDFEVELYEFPDPLIINKEDPTNCAEPEGEIYLIVENETDYLYTLDRGLSWWENPHFTNLYPGNYSIGIASKDLNCVKYISTQVELEVNGAPAISEVVVKDQNSCQDRLGEIIIRSQKESAYLLYSIDQGESWQVDSVFSNLTAGIYFPILKNSLNECIFGIAEGIEVSDVGLLDAEIKIDQELECSNSNNGALDVVIHAGNGPFEYAWSNGQTDRYIHQLESGYYSLTISDASGCQLELEIELLAPDNWDSIKLPNDTMICWGEILEFEFPTNYEYYLFRNGSYLNSGNLFQIIEPGIYQIIVEDGLSCSLEKEFTVEYPDHEFYGIDFLISGRGILEEPIVLVNISDPMPDEHEWKITPQSYVLQEVNNYSQQILFTDTGSYTIELLSFKDDCIIPYSKHIEIFSDSKAQDSSDLQILNISLLDFNIFPNPNDGQFNTDIQFTQSTPCILSLINIHGDLIEKHFLRGEEKYEIEFSMTNLQSGVYSLVLQFDTRIVHQNILILD